MTQEFVMVSAILPIWPVVSRVGPVRIKEKTKNQPLCGVYRQLNVYIIHFLRLKEYLELLCLLLLLLEILLTFQKDAY